MLVSTTAYADFKSLSQRMAHNSQVFYFDNTANDGGSACYSFCNEGNTTIYGLFSQTEDITAAIILADFPTALSLTAGLTLTP